MRANLSEVPLSHLGNASSESVFFTKRACEMMIFSHLSKNDESFANTGLLVENRQPLVLAVDDDPDNLVLMSHVLTLFNCSVLTAVDGQTTLSVSRDCRPDLILLDIRLPDIDGIELIGQIKRDPKLMEIPIIAVTALAKPEDRDRILLAGCADYIRKPFCLDRLEMTIHRYLGLYLFRAP